MLSYMDDKLREANLCERNAYMFLTFDIMILIFEKLCFTYFKLWSSENELNKLMAVREVEVKNPEKLEEYISKHLDNVTPGGSEIPEPPVSIPKAPVEDRRYFNDDEGVIRDLKDSIDRAY
jgi:hypothetical protein